MTAAVAESCPRARAEGRARSVGALTATAWSAQAALCVAFLAHLSPILLWGLAAVIIVAGTMLAARDRIAALALLPGPALLGPICRVEAGGTMIHLGDLYLGMLCLVPVVDRGRLGALRLGRYGDLTLLLLGLCAASWLGSLDPVASIPAMVSIAQLVLVYWLTVAWVRTPDDVGRVGAGWMLGVTLSSALVIGAYARGEPLLLGVDAGYRDTFGNLLASSTVFYRATFFVSGFAFPLACALVSTVAAYVGARLRMRTAAALAVASVVNAVALGLINTKSAIGAAVVGATLAVVLSVASPARARRAMGFLLLGGGLVAVCSLAIAAVMTDVQRELLVARLSDPASLHERFAVWDNVFAYLSSSPMAALVGIGPDISIRRADHPLLAGIFLGGGVQQRAVDSGYLYLALNFGLPAVALILLIGGDALVRFARASLPSGDWRALAAALSIGVWALAAITQQHGLSKPVYLIVQVVAMAGVFRRPHTRTRASRIDAPSPGVAELAGRT